MKGSAFAQRRKKRCMWQWPGPEQSPRKFRRSYREPARLNRHSIGLRWPTLIECDLKKLFELVKRPEPVAHYPSAAGSGSTIEFSRRNPDFLSLRYPGILFSSVPRQIVPRICLNSEFRLRPELSARTGVAIVAIFIGHGWKCGSPPERHCQPGRASLW